MTGMSVLPVGACGDLESGQESPWAAAIDQQERESACGRCSTNELLPKLWRRHHQSLVECWYAGMLTSSDDAAHLCHTQGETAHCPF